MQIQHIFAAQLATISLVGFRRIGEAIAKNNLPVFERRQDHLRDVLRSRSEHESHFCHRRESLSGGVEENATNFFTGRGSSGLARFDYLISRCAQSRRKLPQLRALAGSVEPFEGDELSATQHRGDDISAGASLYLRSLL